MRYPKTRLSALMFVQFFIWGATSPILSLYLKECLGFTGAQVGLILGAAAAGSIVSPALMTFIADRVISPERLLCLLNVAGGALMYVFSRQTGFYPVLGVYVAYSLAMHPTMPLINAITFRRAPTDRRKFGNIRVWGTIGWIAVAWVFGFGIPGDAGPPGGGSGLPILLNISAITSFIMAAYSLTIPKSGRHESLPDNGAEASAGESSGSGSRAGNLSTNRSPGGKTRGFFPADAFRVMMRPQVLALSIIAAALTFIDKFYSFGAAPYLKQAGFSERDIMPAMSLGQIPEIAAMGILGFLLKRWGAKAVLMIGVGLGIFRYGACALGSSDTLIYSGLSVHGLVYTFTMITTVICLDGFCGDRDRAGVHQLYAVLTGGVGGFLGSYGAGAALDIFTDAGTGAVNYGAYWSVPLVLSAAILAAVAALPTPERSPA